MNRLLLVGLLATTTFAQGVRVEAAATPGHWRLTGTDVPILEAVRALGERQAAELAVTPDALESFRGLAADLRCEGSAAALFEWLAGAAGNVVVSGPGRILVDAPSGTPEEAARLATTALRRIVTTPGDPMVADALHALAALARERQDPASCLARSQAFLDHVRAGDPRRPAAYREAIEAAFDVGAPDQAARLLEAMEQDAGCLGKEALFAAMVRMAAHEKEVGQTARALLRLGSVIARARRPSRARATAILLEADLYLADGDGVRAGEVLDRFDVLDERHFPELARRVPLRRGLALLRAGDADAAHPWLLLATFNEGKADEAARAALHLADHHGSRGDAVTALQTLAFAARVARGDALRAEALLRLARFQAEQGLVEATRRTLARVRERTPEFVGDAVALEARALMDDGRHEEAETLLAATPGDDRWIARRDMLRARCLVARRRFDAALALLDAVSFERLDPGSAREASRIRGLCLMADREREVPGPTERSGG